MIIEYLKMKALGLPPGKLLNMVFRLSSKKYTSWSAAGNFLKYGMYYSVLG